MLCAASRILTADVQTGPTVPSRSGPCADARSGCQGGCRPARGSPEPSAAGLRVRPRRRAHRAEDFRHRARGANIAPLVSFQVPSRSFGPLFGRKRQHNPVPPLGVGPLPIFDQDKGRSLLTDDEVLAHSLRSSWTVRVVLQKLLRTISVTARSSPVSNVPDIVGRPLVVLVSLRRELPRRILKRNSSCYDDFG